MKNLDLILNLLCYEGAPTNDPSDATKVVNTVQDPTITGFIRFNNVVANAVTDQVIPLPNADSDYLVILVDREVSIKLNSSETPVTLKPRANGTKTWSYYVKGSITALTVSNASGATANLDIIIANK